MFLTSLTLVGHDNMPLGTIQITIKLLNRKYGLSITTR